MKVMCIGGAYYGDRGPRIKFGQVLRIKSLVEDMGDLMYEFKEHPNWAYQASGFIPVSSKCEVKILRRRREKSVFKRLVTQLSLALKLL